MVQPSPWRATEWLGIVTAGSLWTPLYDEAKMQKNLESLVQQIKRAVSATTPQVSAAIEPTPRRTRRRSSVLLPTQAAEEVHALRSELDQLRQDLAKATNQRAEISGAQAQLEEAPLAPIPAEVPPLSLNLKPNKSMQKLKDMLLADARVPAGGGNATTSLTSQRGVIGAHGMGGLGKTVTASWVARDEDIRQHFELVIWMTLGAAPDLARMRELIFLQLTGNELTCSAIPEQANELISATCRGRCILYVVDDCWDASHWKALNFVDPASASKTLITTRIRGLGGGTEIELGMPSEAEAVELLLSSAGLAHIRPIPKEAAEVVQICSRLPLAVDLAGKRLRDLEIRSADWADIPTLLRDEMRSSRRDEALEYRVIAASLNAIPACDRDACKQVFRCFAVVPEDTYVPLSALQMIHSALRGSEGDLMPQLQLRKYMQILLNRSLVLGTWERPQLHDIVPAPAIFSVNLAPRISPQIAREFILILAGAGTGVRDCTVLSGGTQGSARQSGRPVSCTSPGWW
jgi:hypothetical protein